MSKNIQQNKFKNIRSAYLAAPGLEKQLEKELKGSLQRVGRLFLSSEKVQESCWAHNVWQNAEVIPITSIGDAAKALKQRGHLWSPYYELNIRRAKLIQEKLPRFSGKRLEFLQTFPTTSLGSWTLLDQNTLLASSSCSSSRPNGEWEFAEDKLGPPSRAYLKLWELFTRFGFKPGKEDVCLEIGAAPGGWTWVLAPLCKEVIAYDRAPLIDSVAELSNIRCFQSDAFAITPATHPEVDWVFSDVICTPEKLHQWLLPWFADSKPRNFCTTVKLKGDDYQPWVDKFRSIAKGSLVHLYHNKHELTFILLNRV